MQASSPLFNGAAFDLYEYAPIGQGVPPEPFHGASLSLADASVGQRFIGPAPSASDHSRADLAALACMPARAPSPTTAGCRSDAGTSSMHRPCCNAEFGACCRAATGPPGVPEIGATAKVRISLAWGCSERRGGQRYQQRKISFCTAPTMGYTYIGCTGGSPSADATNITIVNATCVGGSPNASATATYRHAEIS